MGVDIHIKPSVSEVRVEVDESNNSDEDNSISSDDVYINENKMYVTIDVSRYEDIDRDNSRNQPNRWRRGAAIAKKESD